MNIGYNGFCENTITFEADETVFAGALVKLVEDNTVSAATAGDKFCGVCVNVREGYAAVQLKGYVEIPASGEISVGFTSLVAADGATVTTGEGREYLVVSATGATAGFIL